MHRLVWMLAILALTLTACGQSDEVEDLGAAPSAAAGAAEAAVATDPADDTDASAVASDGTPAAGADTADGQPAGSAADEDLPGRPVVWADALNTRAEAGVTGVEADDVLNVRSLPGPDQQIVERLAPLRTGVALTGRARMVGDAAWYEIRADDTVGWVHSAFIDLVAGTTDITAEVRDANLPPTAASMRELAEQVVRARGLDEGYQLVWGPRRVSGVSAEEQRRVVISDGPRVGDLGEITVDVIDTFDDSVAAERLTIFGQPAGDGFSLRSVERTLFCDVTRGAGQTCA